MEPDLLLGVDGGGSKTRACISTIDGKRLGLGTAASSNFRAVGFDAATAALGQAIAGAEAEVKEKLHLASGEPLSRRIAAACFGLAGVGQPAGQAMMARWVDDLAIAARFSIVNDSALVLAAGTPDNWGVALISGTGSICYGRAADSRIARAGGWGYRIGDEGSGYHLAIAALHMATQTADGRADAQAILRAVLDEWHLESPARLIDHVYRDDMASGEIATLAPRILGLAREGDAHAQGLLAAAGDALALLVGAVVRKLKLKRAPVAFGGGLLRASDELQRAVYERAGVELGPSTTVAEPVDGALILASRLL